MIGADCSAAGRCVLVVLHDHGAACGQPCACARCRRLQGACQVVDGSCRHADHRREARMRRAT